eukprot:1930838-Alexandrium_andersonii.AAC.1
MNTARRSANSGEFVLAARGALLVIMPLPELCSLAFDGACPDSQHESEARCRATGVWQSCR